MERELKKYFMLSENKRNYGIDFLRMLAMLMIVMLHTLSRSQLLYESVPLSLKYETIWFIEIACYCAVDCFVLISGYVGLHSKFRISRVILLWLQVVFYNFGFELLYQIYSMNMDVRELIRSFFPVMTDTYWFFTQYFLLSFLMPFINKWIKSLTIRQNIALVSIFFFFFSFIPMVVQGPIPILGGDSDADPFFTGRGYSILWFIVIYIVGATFKRLVEKRCLVRLRMKIPIFLYFGGVLFTWFIKYLCDNGRTDISAYFAVNYTGIGVVISACGIFLFFVGFQFSEKSKRGISLIAPATFAVYLIHSNPVVYPLYVKQVAPLLNMRLLKLLPCLLLTVVIVFLLCILIDYIRKFLFRILKINNIFSMLDDLKINQWFN